MSAKVGGTGERWFYRANTTLIDYGDFRVPTDSIDYYDYRIPLDRGRMRNTAGHERDGSLMVGYAGYHFHTDLRISESYSKSGFFANAHGLEVRLSEIDYDASSRDIDLPYQSVNHLKVQSHSAWHYGRWEVESNLAYQSNHRRECSEPVSHGYMPTPPDERERLFDKQTYTALLSARWTLSPRHTLMVGAGTEHQHNRRDGWGFILPDFETSSVGGYVAQRYTASDHLIYNVGLRYDWAQTHIHSYTDWYQTPVQGVPTYVERSADLLRHFNSITWSAGVNYEVADWVVKANVGKSFRMPIPKELGADGINYHIFRYDRGNRDLDPEQSYQLDAGISWAHGKWSWQLDPYVNYFPNYIYLNPTSDYVEGLQLYHYTQAEVLRYGFETQLEGHLDRHWTVQMQGEYLWARQQSGQKKGYTLPFCPP